MGEKRRFFPFFFPPFSFSFGDTDSANRGRPDSRGRGRVTLFFMLTRTCANRPPASSQDQSGGRTILAMVTLFFHLFFPPSCQGIDTRRSAVNTTSCLGASRYPSFFFSSFLSPLFFFFPPIRRRTPTANYQVQAGATHRFSFFLPAPNGQVRRPPLLARVASTFFGGPRQNIIALFFFFFPSFFLFYPFPFSPSEAR